LKRRGDARDAYIKNMEDPPRMSDDPKALARQIIQISLAAMVCLVIIAGCDKGEIGAPPPPQISPTFLIAAIDTVCSPGESCIKFYAQPDMDVVLTRVIITSPLGNSQPYELGNYLLPKYERLALQPGDAGGTWTFEFLGKTPGDSTSRFDVSTSIAVSQPEAPPAFTLSWSDTSHGGINFYAMPAIDIRLFKIVATSPSGHSYGDSTNQTLVPKDHRFKLGLQPREAGTWHLELAGTKVASGKAFDVIDTLVVPVQPRGPDFLIQEVPSACGLYQECIRFQAKPDSDVILAKVEITNPGGSLFTYYVGNVLIYRNQLIDLEQAGYSFIKVLGIWKFEFYGRLANGSKASFDKMDSLVIVKTPPAGNQPDFQLSFDSTVCGSFQRCVQFQAKPDMDVYVISVEITNPNRAVEVFNAGNILVAKDQPFALQQYSYSYHRYGGLWRFTFTGSKASGDNASYTVTDSLFLSP
jgi:hypothetical protein